jgi:hypothetical protein
VSGTTSQPDSDAQSDRTPEGNDDATSPVEQAEAREREMEESGEENAA